MRYPEASPLLQQSLKPGPQAFTAACQNTVRMAPQIGQSHFYVKLSEVHLEMSVNNNK